MAKTMNLGKVAMTTGGAYDSSKSYERLTCVLYNHVSWVSRKEVPAGIVPGTNDVYWQKVSERGEQGIQGSVGPQGNSAFDGTGVEIINNLTAGGEAAVLSAEQGKILSKCKNVVNNYEHGYISYDNTIKRNNTTAQKFIMLPVSEGEQYSFYSKYATSLFIAFCETENTWFSRQNVIEGWQSFTIPSGCKYVAVSLQFTEEQGDAVDNAFLYNTKITEQLSSITSELKDKLNTLDGVENTIQLLCKGKNIVNNYEHGYVIVDRIVAEV